MTSLKKYGPKTSIPFFLSCPESHQQLISPFCQQLTLAPSRTEVAGSRTSSKTSSCSALKSCLRWAKVRKSANRNLEQRTWTCQRQRGCVMALFITGHMAIDFLLLTQDISVTPASALPTLLFCQVYLYFSPALKANQVNWLLHEIKQNN